MKKYRYFYHYYRQYDCLSVHWKGQCHKVDSVKVFNVSEETKRNKRQPRLVIQGFAKEIKFENGEALIYG